jgi:hypothetical protein
LLFGRLFRWYKIYLDCMQNKGSGEEMAEAILKKRLIKNDTGW